MNRFRVFLVSSLVFGGLMGVVGTPASALPPLPTGAGDITPEVNWSQFISPIMNASAISCTVNSVSNNSDVTIGQTLSPMSNPLVDGMKLRSVVSDSDADVGATCTSDVTIPSTPIKVTGTISAPGMASVPGVGTSGNMDLNCTAKSSTPTVTVTVSANFGGAVTGKARITGQSSSASIAFNCSMGLTFNAGTGIAGTVAGSLTIGNPTANQSCSGQASPTCIPVSLVNATVTVTGGSGALAEAAGSGTYSFNDSFKLPGIDSALSMVGVSSIRKMSAPRALAANSDELKLNLQAGKHKVSVAGVSSSSFTFKSGTQVQITSSPSSQCKVRATFKRTTVTLASPRLATTGTATVTISSSAVKKIKAAGAKKNTKIAMTTSCTSGSKTATAKSSPKFAG